jgi:hypothetical protein
MARSIDSTSPSPIAYAPPRLDVPTHRSAPLTAEQQDFENFMASLPVSLSPSMIIAMLQRRMGSLDGQIQADVRAMEDQQAQLTDLQSHGQIVLAVKAASDANGEIATSTPVTIDGETKTAGEWLAQAGVQVAANPEGGTHHSGPWFDGAGLTAASESISAEVKVVNQGTELKMMELQSLMQQRSSEISLATNMLKAVQDGTDAIVRNLG